MDEVQVKEPKFKVQEPVEIVCCPRHPRYVGRKGWICKVAHDGETGEPLYRVCLFGRDKAIDGWAEEDCLKKAEV